MFFGARDAYINDGGWRGWEREGKSGVSTVVFFGRMCGRFCGGVGRDCGMPCRLVFNLRMEGGLWRGCVREDFVLLCGQWK